MTIKRLTSLAAALLLGGLMVNANAASISLAPGFVDNVFVGDTISFDIMLDFSDLDAPSIGGGFDIIYDSAVLGNAQWTYAAYGDPGFQNVPTFLDGEIDGVSVGDFFTGIGGPTGIAPGVIGSLSFDVIGLAALEGITNISMQDTDNILVGTFITFTGQDVNATYNGAQVNVVPVPAALWLMIGGLGTLLGLRRK